MNNIRLMKSPVSIFNKLNTQEKYNGYKWIFHLTDKDTKFPSVLHAHSAEKSLKLDGFTGEIYDIKTKKKIDKLDHDTLNQHYICSYQASLLGVHVKQEVAILARSLA